MGGEGNGCGQEGGGAENGGRKAVELHRDVFPVIKMDRGTGHLMKATSLLTPRGTICPFTLPSCCIALKATGNVFIPSINATAVTFILNFMLRGSITWATHAG
jgi:hypothetical protein